MINKKSFSILLLNLVNNKISLINDTLTKYEYKVESTDNTEECILKIKETNSFDVVIINTDYSDLESEDAIIQIQNTSKSKIVFLTSDNNDESRVFLDKYSLLDYKVKLNNLFDILSQLNILFENIIDNKKENILIIKKDTIDRQKIIDLLKLRAYNVTVANNGAQGWKEIVNIDNLSLVILDLNIKDMNTSELIDKVKKEYYKDVPIIAVASYYSHLTLQINIANGLSDFLKMPIINDEFNLKIDLWISNVKQKREIKIQQNNIEQALKSFKLLANATIEALIMFEDNICVDVNESSLDMFNCDDENDLLGKHIFDVIAVDIDVFDKEELLRSNIDHMFDIEMKKKDGSTFPAKIKEKNLVLEGKKLKVIAVLDMSDIRKKEEMLSQQSKMASMGEMIGNIAHQWRQPLSSISIAASGLKLHAELGLMSEEDVAEQLDNIVTSTEFLSNTISDFQSFLKGTQVKEDYTIQQVVSRVLKLIDGNIKKGSLTIVSKHEDDISLNGFANELVQSVLNIINNSKDAYESIDKDIKPIIVSSALSDDKTKMIIKIHDGAGGINDAIMQSIFEPYFTTKHKSQGTGLGLYMTHKMLIENMKGNLSVSNERFQYSDESYFGARFVITIPFA